MTADDILLMIPGPTNLPAEVREALSRPAMYHRGSEFAALLDECTRGLQEVFQTHNEVLILTSSGTGAVEAAIVNALSPGDRVLAIESGKFGERMADIAEAFGAQVERMTLEPGQAADPEAVGERVKGCAALLFVQNETSTGVRQDADQLAAVAHEAGALVIVDTVSSMGGMPIYTDSWGLDLVAAGSQKALMLPPGLGFVAVSEAGWQAAERASMPKYYFDLVAARKSLAKGQTPWTPNVSMIRALKASLDLIKNEGLENVWRRHRALGEATRAAVEAAGLELLADPHHASDVVTAVKAPGGIDSTELVRRVVERHGILISGGQGQLKGKIFRIGHMGCCQMADLLRTLEAVMLELGEMGFAAPIAEVLDAARAAYKAAYEEVAK